jgi:hypothetical protein
MFTLFDSFDQHVSRRTDMEHTSSLHCAGTVVPTGTYLAYYITTILGYYESHTARQLVSSYYWTCLDYGLSPSKLVVAREAPPKLRRAMVYSPRPVCEEPNLTVPGTDSCSVGCNSKFHETT